MAQRRKQTRWNRFRTWINPALDDFAGIGVLTGSTGLTTIIRDVHSDTKKAYKSNVTDITRVKQKSPQLTFAGQKPYMLERNEARKIKELIERNFKVRNRGEKFGFYPRTFKTVKAIRNPFRNPKKLRIQKEVLNELRARNIKSFKKVLRFHSPKTALMTGLTFLSFPVARALQADYAPKRKFKKELGKTIKRGAITPTIGYIGGSNLDRLLTKYPSLRGSRKIRQLEGKYAQKYGQGVQFYRGTSGLSKQEIKQIESGYKRGQTLTQADIKKLDRYFKTVNEYRRRAKRRRGK